MDSIVDAGSTKILLALNPLEKGIRPSRLALENLSYWTSHVSGSSRTAIEAVYVLSDLEGNVKMSKTQEYAETALENSLRELDLHLPISTKILNDQSFSQQGAIERLLEYARESKAELLVVFSHGRVGIQRLFYGSFTEDLLNKSSIPILFSGLKPKSGSGFDRVIFVTDFSENSKEAFRIFLHQVSSFKPEVLVFYSHSPLSEIYNYALTGVGMGVGIPYYTVEDYESKKLVQHRMAEEWSEMVTLKGMKAQIMNEDENLTQINPLRAIKALADQNHCVLLGLAATMEGSVSKDLFRQRNYNVWVYGPNAGKLGP